MDQQTPALTPFEREIEAVSRFRFRDLFTPTAPEGACPVCHEKYWGWGSTCDRCRDVR